ncbi:mitotic checkpoint regulator, MAD2B-interacting-domain-containing protein [Jackrogersella minutella]|nr:mitotic checkpoint regulator, MAD2B-interacting-domain-containing protein [Jackrogersella minutella]
MGLVDYSDSDSESEPVVEPTPAPAPAASGKKTFQKVVDRSKPGKILVNLPQTSSRDENKPIDGADEPPAKRARTGGRGGGAFSGFNSFLPPPKNVGKPAVASSSGKPATRPGINLKTGAAPGFSRDINTDGEGGGGETATRSEDADPTTKQPSIPAEQKPAEEVKLVGKPLMFKPLSVSRKPNKKGTGKSITASKAGVAAPSASTSKGNEAPKAKTEQVETGPPPKKQKISLFSISTDERTTDAPENATSTNSGAYEPMFSTEDPSTTEFAAYDAQYFSTAPTSHQATTEPGPSNTDSLSALATSMNLSATARRELFGRGGDAAAMSASRVVNFDTNREYEHNEALRASGQLQPAYNPIRAIAPGKHNLRQLVSQVQNQRDALEESFAKGKTNRSEAGSRYGWR